MTKRKLSPKVRPRTTGRNARAVPDTHPDAENGTGDSFALRTAFENLVHDLRDVEALAVAADEALEALPFVDTKRQRRAVGRLYSLVTATAAAAKAALDVADETQSRLNGAAGREDEGGPADLMNASCTASSEPPSRATRSPRASIAR